MACTLHPLSKRNHKAQIFTRIAQSLRKVLLMARTQVNSSKVDILPLCHRIQTTAGSDSFSFPEGMSGSDIKLNIHLVLF